MHTYNIEYSKSDFEEIYFENSLWHIIISNVRVVPICVIIIFVIYMITNLFFYPSTKMNSFFPVLFLFTFVSFVLVVYDLSKIIKWYRNVKRTIYTNTKYKESIIALDDNKFVFECKGEKYIHNLNQVKIIKILEDYTEIAFNDSERYLLPRKSFEKGDYKNFTNQISEINYNINAANNAPPSTG